MIPIARARPRPRLVVKEHAPWRHWVLVAGSTTVIALVAFAIYSYSMSRMPYLWEQVEGENARLQLEKARLQERIRDLRAENERQAEQIVLLQRSIDIDGEAKKDVREEMNAQQKELSSLKEQLAFYRGIVSPEQSKAGVRVYQLAIRPDTKIPRQYLFDLVLIQALRHDRTVHGRVRVEIVGVLDGRPVRFPLDELPPQGQNALTFSFKYFQQLAGTFQLPEGVTPTGVRTVLDSDGEDARVEDTYKWSEVFH